MSNSDNRKIEYHLEHDVCVRSYLRYRDNLYKKVTKQKELAYNPIFSIVIPVYNVVSQQLIDAIESVINQSYTNYELILIDDNSSWDNVVPVLKAYENHKKIKVIYRSENGHISKATNDGINASTGDYIVFMDCDDTIENDALYEFANKLNENPELDFIYSDEDKVTEDGKVYHLPFFKPDWSPDLFLSCNYTNHLSVYRTSIVKKIGGLRSEYNGSQDYDMVLRFMEHSDNSKVGHISKVLYHWRERAESVAFSVNSKNYAVDKALLAKKDAMKRRGINATFKYVKGETQSFPVYDVIGNPLVSIVIPSKDNPDILKQCIESIYKFLGYKNIEIIVVDNGSSEANREIIESFLREKKAIYIFDKQKFNFSKMCNTGAKQSNGEFILFLNDDIEVFDDKWLSTMLGTAQQSHVGVVGAKLYYPNSTIIQHAGVSSIKEGPSHDFFREDDSNPSYFMLNWIPRNCLVVTGACLLLSRDNFEKIEGFDESLPVAYNDVDLCYKLAERGLYNVVRNDVVLFHHESLSRGDDAKDTNKFFRLSKERMRLDFKHPLYYKNDPFLNKNLHLYSGLIDINENYSIIEELSKCEKKDVNDCPIENYLDGCDLQDSLRIFGWSKLREQSTNDIAEISILLKHPAGPVYKVKTTRERREDVAVATNNEKLLYCGYESVIDKKKIRTDLYSYDIGFMYSMYDGNKYIVWTDKKTPFYRHVDEKVQYADFSIYNELVITEDKKKITYGLEKIERVDDGVLIQGWSFCDKKNHYKYDTSVILVPKKGKIVELFPEKEERIDVAAALSYVPFLLYAGFSCYVLEDILEKNVEYKVIIRHKNRFNETDVNDVDTSKKVIIK